MKKTSQQSNYLSIKSNAFEEWRNFFNKVSDFSANSDKNIREKDDNNLDSIASSIIGNKTPEKKNKYHRKFMEKLIANSTTNFPLKEWKYVGGNSGRHSRWYQNLYPDCAFPSSKNSCICSHPIIENCYIQNNNTNLILVVGNCCIKRFLPLESQGRACPKCQEPHRNRNDPWCDSCRGGILTVGHHKGRSFRWILERKPYYGRFILGISPRGELARLANWLRENGLTIKKLTSQSTGRVRGKKVFVDTRKQNIRRIAPLPMKTKNSFRDKQMKQILEANSQKLNFGQYRQKTYKWVLDSDPKYCEWVSKVKLPGGWMANFQSWLQLSNRRN
uniref:Uncharacterized protein n=1 Tax=Pithovirus LCPAC202 TaxID=2506592 RepID=A0A481Z5U7_9VIRU|nr:MAG: hypothetical protein LCPAC202_02480 [Pithovirus LCPAC202]